MYDDVLLPVARGEVEENPAVERAVSLAEQYDATLHLLSVVDPIVFDPITPKINRVHEALEEGAEKAVDEAAERARSRDVDVETHVGRGIPHDVITEYAGDHADILVIATHGREGLDHALLGSVTEKVVRSAEVPVLSVPLS
ncbi:MAG: universal stress protein [Halolamina sp.]|uniref:universal stress protein n=1 Tax=Halolamina sp. TaxID=1940283 RepID=UPI002FC37F64